MVLLAHRGEELGGEIGLQSEVEHRVDRVDATGLGDVANRLADVIVKLRLMPEVLDQQLLDRSAERLSLAELLDRLVNLRPDVLAHLGGRRTSSSFSSRVPVVA